MITVKGKHRKKRIVSSRFWSFDNLYLVVMTIYMAQMTSATRVNTFNMIDFIAPGIPLFLTAIQAFRFKVKFSDRQFWLVMSVLLTWFVCYLFKMLLYGGQTQHWNVMYIFFIITYSYVMCRVYGRSLFYLFERIMVVLSLIAFACYLFQLVLPDVADRIFTMFPLAGHGGNNVLYLYHYVSANNEEYFLELYGHLLRNSGFAWEPGRYSIMLVPAILFNMYRRQGHILKNNRNFYILNIALISTFSTTGLCTAFIMYAMYMINKLSVKSVLIAVFVLIPAGFILYTQSFVVDKFDSQMEISGDMDTYREMVFQGDDAEEHHAIDRLPSLMFECMNISEDPLLGYGHWFNSYFYKNVTEVVRTTGGVLHVFGYYGLLLGGFLYWCLWRSSAKIAQSFKSKKKALFMIVVVLSSVSYPVFDVILFNTFWMYGMFVKNEQMNMPIKKIKLKKIYAK